MADFGSPYKETEALLTLIDDGTVKGVFAAADLVRDLSDLAMLKLRDACHLLGRLIAQETLMRILRHGCLTQEALEYDHSVREESDDHPKV